MKHNIVLLGFLFCSFLLITQKTFAQETLTLEEAVRIALERNYDIKLVSNELKIDQNNVNRANAGMLPVVGATLTNNNTLQNSSQTRATGEVTERNGAKGSSLNYGVGLTWTVFDGFGMFARYDQLKELQKLGEAQLQNTVLTKVGDVITIYYDLVQQQQQLRALDTAVAISRLRVETAQNRFQIGKAARLEVLNAQVDFNTDTTNLLRQRQLYRNTQTQLNEQLAREVTTAFKVVDSVTIDDQLTLGQLAEQATQQNPALQAALINRRVAALDLKQVKANRFPTINLNSGYNFNRSESALGFATQTTGRGLNYGVSASVNVFNGFLQKKNERNAAILIDNAQLQYEQLQVSIKAQLATAFETYQTNLSLVNLEERNQRIAKQNLDITLDKFRLGSITPIEVRDAQLNYVNATVRYSNALYQAKLAEVDLKEIAGALNF
ncbi:TolC family protein [Pontibacter liquoris]|uniref:TolC family protein n=1 Tax=Pontibacter liquoris TaxID=2905677 RepID=UPI001FA70204|nr:TolC family protein [Pontibacter liquoris]